MRLKAKNGGFLQGYQVIRVVDSKAGMILHNHFSPTGGESKELLPAIIATILLPLYLKTVVETNPALELYGAILPMVAVTCQLPVSRSSKGLTAVRSIALGTFILSLGMLLNLPPLFLEGGPRAVLGGLPVGSLAPS